MVRKIAVIGLLLALPAACHQQGEQRQPAPRVAAPVGGIAIAPGSYDTRATITEVALPGAPGALAAQMKAMLSGTPQQARFCLSAEAAARGPAALTERLAQGRCHTDHFAAAHGAIDAVYTCQTARGQRVRSTIGGTYSARSSSLTITTQTTNPGRAAPDLTISQQVEAERAGDC